MADDQGTAPDADTPQYKAPAKMSVEEIKNMDTEDESLAKYKQTLLAGSAIEDDDERNVRPLKMTIKYPDHPEQPPAVIDLTCDKDELKKKVIKMKEGVAYEISLSFIVAREIVSGLNFKLNLFKHGLKVNTAAYMVGSYGPNKDPYEAVVVKDQEAPDGVTGRGEYTAKGKFTDDDKHEHLLCEWKIKISKEWK